MNPPLTFFLLVLLPASILLFWARRLHRSPHWVWWAVTGYGWIAVVYLLGKKPLTLKARYQSENLVCTTCGAIIQIGPKQVQQHVLHRILFGLLGTAALRIAAGREHTCPNCGVIPPDSLPSRAYTKMRLTQIGLFLLVAMVLGAVLMLVDVLQKR